MLIGIRDAAIVFFFKVIVGQVGIVASTQPELLDELLALFVRFQLQESLTLFVRNNVNDILVEPLLVRSDELFERFLDFPLLFFVELLRDRRCVVLWLVLRTNLRSYAS